MDQYRIPKEKILQLKELLNREKIDALLILSREASDPSLPFLIGADCALRFSAKMEKTG